MRSFDYSVLKNKTWDNEILGLVAQIHEYKGRQELYLRQKPEELDRLVEITKTQSTEASNEIEGIRTTNTRLKQLVADETTPQNREEEEIIGYCSRSEEHTSELQSRFDLVCRLLLEKKKKQEP